MSDLLDRVRIALADLLISLDIPTMTDHLGRFVALI